MDIVVFAQIYDRAAIFSRDRDISSTADSRSFGGGDFRSSFYPGRVAFPPVGRFVLRPDLDTPTPHSARIRHHHLNTSPLAPLHTASGHSTSPRYIRNFRSGPPGYLLQVSVSRDLCDKYLTAFADFKVTRSFFSSVLAPVPFQPDPFKQADGVTPISPFGISVAEQSV